MIKSIMGCELFEEMQIDHYGKYSVVDDLQDGRK